jgi:polyhydroxyalkanoate synthase
VVPAALACSSCTASSAAITSLDLRPGNSLVEFLTDFAFDVFLLDCGVPDELDAENTLETYVDEYLPRAVDAVRPETGADELTMMGYCLGGVISALYASAYDDAPSAT